MDNMESIFGQSLMEKVRTANKRQRRFEFSDITKKELLVSLKDNFEKAFDVIGEFRYDWTVGSNKYVVALLKTPEEITYKTGSGKGDSTWHMTKLKYGSDFRRNCSVFLTEEQFKSLVADQEYVCVGYMKTGEYMGRPTYSFNLHEIVALAEVNNELAKLREKGL
jgi:hypothetical protein